MHERAALDTVVISDGVERVFTSPSGGAPLGASNADRWAGARPDYLVCGGGGGGDGGGDGGGGGATAAAALFGVGVVEGSPFFVLDVALGCLSYVYSVASEALGRTLPMSPACSSSGSASSRSRSSRAHGGLRTGQRR